MVKLGLPFFGKGMIPPFEHILGLSKCRVSLQMVKSGSSSMPLFHTSAGMLSGPYPLLVRTCLA